MLKEFNKDHCWLFAGTIDKLGYGRIKLLGGSSLCAHRLLYEVWVGEIPEGYVLDHLCYTPCCINPEHLEPVTIAENVLRGYEMRNKLNPRTHCSRNHELTEENIYSSPNGRRKWCRTCERMRSRKRNWHRINLGRKEK